jgi:hypothetical protein
VAAATCAQCHGVVDAHCGALAFVAIAAMLSTSQKSLGVFLQMPQPSMPNLILSGADRNDVIAYILSLRR